MLLREGNSCPVSVNGQYSAKRITPVFENKWSTILHYNNKEANSSIKISKINTMSIKMIDWFFHCDIYQIIKLDKH